MYNSHFMYGTIYIRIEMLTIIKWLSVNKLSLNVDKTQILIFDNANFSVKINIGIGNKYHIKECKSYKYLGLYVDNKLKFNLHVDYIKKKIQKRIGAMYRGSSLYTSNKISKNVC